MPGDAFSAFRERNKGWCLKPGWGSRCGRGPPAPVGEVGPGPVVVQPVAPRRKGNPSSPGDACSGRREPRGSCTNRSSKLFK